MNILNSAKSGTSNLVVIEPKDTKLDDITIALPAAKTISILAATYENYNVKVITQTNNGEENLITNIVAVKKGDDLVVTGADASKVIFRGFYTLCEDGACTVTLGGGEEGVTITPDSPIGEALSDGSFMVYTYADSGVLADMLTEDDGETLGLSDLPEGKVSYVPITNEKTNEETNAQENNDEGSHWGWIAGGIALAAVGIKAFDDSDNNVNTPTTGEVTITGTQTQGEILTADTSALMDADGVGSFSYQWWASDADGSNNYAITGATSKALTLSQAQVGKTITVVVTHTDAQGMVEPAITSAATAAVTNVNDPTLGDVTITKAQTGAATPAPAPAQGETLTADTSAVTDVDGVGTFTYQWWAASGTNNYAIVGATDKTLILTQAQVGKAITVVVIHTDALGTVEPAIISMATDPVENVNDPTLGEVYVRGTPIAGENLTAHVDALTDADGLGTFSYQWQVDGEDIAGATSATLTLTQAHVYKPITVVVKHTDLQGTEETKTSASKVINSPTTGEVTIEGTPKEGEDLTAVTSALMDGNGVGSFTYQWWAASGTNSDAIAGATSKTLTLTQAHEGKTITVVVTHTDALGKVEPEITSEAIRVRELDTTVAIASITDNVGSNQGLLDNGDRTDDSSPKLTGTIFSALQLGEVVAIYDGTTRLGEAEVTENAGVIGWTFDLAPAVEFGFGGIAIPSAVAGQPDITDTSAEGQAKVDITANSIIRNTEFGGPLNNDHSGSYAGSFSADQPLTDDITISATTVGVGIRSFGFSKESNDRTSLNIYTSADYAWYLTFDLLLIVEGGKLIQQPLTDRYKPGDTIALQRTGTIVEYLLNGEVKYTSTVESTGDLHLDISLQRQQSAGAAKNGFENISIGASTLLSVGDHELFARVENAEGQLGLDSTIRNVNFSLPEYQGAEVSNNTLTLTFDEPLNGDSVPDASAFSVKVDNEASSRVVTAVTISGNNVVLTFDGAAITDANVTSVSYTPPSSGSVLQDAQGNSDVTAINNTLVGNNGDNTLIGTPRADIIIGNAGDDIIQGNEGADTLSGGAGSDTFNYPRTLSSPRLPPGTPSNVDAGDDTITDFTLGRGGDKLELSGLLHDYNVFLGRTDLVIELSLNDYLTVTDDGVGRDVTIVVDPDGRGASMSTLAITLQGIGTGALTLDDFTEYNLVAVAEQVL